MLPAVTDPANPSPPPVPATHSAVLDRIRAFVRENGWSPGKLAAEAGLSRGTLGPLFTADWSPSSATILACEALIPADWKPGDPVPAAASRSAPEAA